MKTLLLFLLLQQVSTPYFKKDATGKVVPCGTVDQWNAYWQVHLKEAGTHSQLFETRAEAVAWIKPYCPIEGTK